MFHLTPKYGNSLESTNYIVTFSVILLTMVAILISLILISRMSWRKLIGSTFILMFVLSYFWTYVRCYYEAVAKQEASYIDIPGYCNGQREIYFTEKFSRMWNSMFSTGKDPCTRYHEYYLIKPIYTLNPIKIFMITVSEVILEPLKQMGTAFSKTFHNIFEGFPVLSWIVAVAFMILSMVAFIFILPIFLGYSLRIRLPFFTGFELISSENYYQELTQSSRRSLQGSGSVVVNSETNSQTSRASGGQTNKFFLWKYLGVGKNTSSKESQSTGNNQKELPKNKNLSNATTELLNSKELTNLVPVILLVLMEQQNQLKIQQSKIIYLEATLNRLIREKECQKGSDHTHSSLFVEEESLYDDDLD